MSRILATIKAPVAEVEHLKAQLKACGIDNVVVKTVPYSQFVEESRLNFDCAYPQMWEEQIPVAYIDFSFEATNEGRSDAFFAEYNIMQIPLNLRYDFQ